MRVPVGDRAPMLVLAVGLAVAVGIPAMTSGRRSPASPGHGDAAHGHPAQFGGVIEALGSYHVEAVRRASGEVRLYILGPDAETLWPIQEPTLSAEMETPNGLATPLVLKARPQTGDGQGASSLFVGKAPYSPGASRLTLVVPVEGRRYRARLEFGTEEGSADHGAQQMPKAVSATKEEELYLTPGGAYTEADIEANGRMLASAKFAGFQAEHNMNPAKGDRICPVTSTKANPKCSWIIGGKSYLFCCPPCVDEFLRKAKKDPSLARSPESYVRR